MGDKHLKPDTLDIDVGSASAELNYRHWSKTFANYKEAVKKKNADIDEVSLLIAHVSPTVYAHIADEETYEDAIAVLEKLYIKPKNIVCSRYLLLSNKQGANESIDDFVTRLRQLTKHCDFKAVTAAEYINEMLLNAFVSGISDHNIRQRLLEVTSTSFDEAYKVARSLESTKSNSQRYDVGFGASVVENPSGSPKNFNSVCAVNTENIDVGQGHQVAAAVQSSRQKSRRYFCYYCGKPECTVKATCVGVNGKCTSCHKDGHLVDVCFSKKKHEQRESRSKGRSAAVLPFMPTMSAAKRSDYSETVMKTIILNNTIVRALLDTGSTMSFILESFARRNGFNISPVIGDVKLADGTKAELCGECDVTLTLEGSRIENVCLFVLPSLAADVIIGADIFQFFSNVNFEFGGSRPTLNSNAVQSCPSAQHSVISQFLTSDCHPIATKSRSYSKDDRDFMEKEVTRLYNERKISKSHSPWRSQPFIVKKDQYEEDPDRRMVIDYSRTINKFTMLDAYPLPKISEIVNNVAHFKVLSSLDLKRAYHQIPLHPDHRP